MGECVGLVRFSNMYCFRVYHGLNFSVEGRETSRAFVHWYGGLQNWFSLFHVHVFCV